MRTLSFALIVSVLGIAIAMPQKRSAAQPYDEPDAYKIYSLLLPEEESYGFAKDTLIIQEETLSNVAVVGACLTPEVQKQFKDAISHYERSRSKPWLLQRRFKIEKPYEIVNSDTINRPPASEKLRSNSGGYIFMSPVGFNKEKTRAIVYTGSTCGVLCGRSRFHLLQKVRGQWKEISGVTCVTVS